MNELVKKIRSRGYWEVVIRPAEFVEKRLPEISELYPIVERSSVNLRGWDFPHLDYQPLHVDVDWIGQELEWEDHLELWRFYQSGQFFHISGMIEDWRERSGLSRPSKVLKPGLFLDVEDVVLRFTEIFEFAARLALTKAGDEQLHLRIAVGCIQDRALLVNPARRAGASKLARKKASIKEFPYEADLSRDELIANARELALSPARELFRSFNWDPDTDLLREIQDKLLQRV